MKAYTYSFARVQTALFALMLLVLSAWDAMGQCTSPPNLATNNITSNSVNVTWNSVPTAVSYEVQWSSPGGSSGTQQTSQTSFFISSLQASTNYEVKVRSVCPGGSQSAFATTTFSTTGSACAAPTGLTATSGGATSINLNWNTVTEATNYFISYNVVGNANVFNQVATAPPFTITGVTANTAYSISVRANCGQTGLSAFTTITYDPNQTATCNVPTGLQATNVTNNSATLSWSAVQGASSYDVTYKRTSEQNFTTLSTATPSVNISSLVVNSTYEVRVRAFCGVGNFSAFSPSINFITSAGGGACAVPANFSAQSVTQNSASLTWTPVTGALNYEVSFRKVGLVNFTIITTNNNSVTLNNLETGVTYDVRVRAFCGNDVFSAYATSTLQTGGQTGQCATPAGLMTLTITGTTAELSWANVPNVTNYTVSYRPIGAAEFQIVTVTNNSTVLTNLTPGTPYEARVRATCSNGVVSSENGVTFSTQSQIQCPAPTGLTVTSVNTTLATVAWVGNQSAIRYEVSYKATTSPTYITFEVTNTNANINALSPGFNYDVRVRAICSAGNFSDYIATQFFTPPPTPCAVPGNFRSTGITTTNATVTWDAVESAQNYEVSYRRTNDQTFITLTTNQTTITLQALNPSTTYTVRVRARCAVFSDYATILITTPAIPVNCGTPTNFMVAIRDESSVTVSWTAVPTAEAYIVGYRFAGQGTFTEQETTATSLLLAGLTGGRTYDAYVRTRCNTGTFSEPASTQFTLTGGVCPAPSNLQFQNISTVSANITWTAAPNFPNYEFAFRPAGTVNYTIRMVTGTTFGLTDLAPNTNYEVRIRTACGGETYSNGLEGNFTTGQTSGGGNCLTPSVLVASDIAPTSAKITWNTESTFPRFELSYRRAQDLVYTTRVIEGKETTLTGLAPNSNYEIRVRNICADGVFSGFRINSFTTNPEAGSCPPPVNLRTTEISFNSIKLVWQDGGAGQQYELAYRKVGDMNFSNTVVVVSTEYTITNLDQGTNYEVRLRAQCGSAFSDNVFQSFRTEGSANACVAPTNLRATNVTDVSATLSWDNANPGVGIFFEVGYRPAGTTEYITRTTAQPTFNITDLLSNVRYEFRVRTACTGTIFSAYANSTFTTETAGFGCEQPSNFFTQNVLPTGAMLTWTAAAGVSQYEIAIRVAGSGANFQVFQTPLNMYSFGNLTPNTRYEVRLRSVCGARFSAPLTNFVTTLDQITCDTPKNLAVNNVTGEAALVSWTAVPNATNYNVSYRMQGQVVTRSFIVGSNVTQYYLIGLVKDASYVLSVSAICGTQSSLPATLPFTTNTTNFCFPPTRPVANDITETTALISWDAAAAGTMYEIAYKRVGDITFTGFTTRNTSQRLVNLTSGTNYEVRLRTYCGNSLSNWTSFNFSTANTSNPCLAPNVILVSKTSTVATLNWGPQQSAYELSIRVSGGTWNTTLETAPPPLVLRNLTPGTMYEMRIRNLCEGRFSDYSNLISFTTDGNPCATPTISLQTRTASSITINLSGNVAVYEVSYREVNTPTFTRVLATNPSSFTIGGLTPNRTYEIQVRNFCNGIYSESSNRLVVTASNAPQNCPSPTLDVRNVSARQATLFWNINMTFYEVVVRNVNTNFTSTSYHTTLGSLTLSNLTPNTPYEVSVRNVCGSAFSEAGRINFTTPFIREEMENANSINDLSLYPNPNNGNFSLNFTASEAQTANLVMTDMSGKTVWSMPVSTQAGRNEMNISLDGVPAGMYLLQVSQGEMRQTVKVIVQ
jgi:hypothetical protein